MVLRKESLLNALGYLAHLKLISGAFFESTLKNAKCVEDVFACKSWKDNCQERIKGHARDFEGRLEQKVINLCWTQILSKGDSMSLNEKW